MLERFAIDQLASAPWKNGGGSTREIACWPPGAGFDDFDWRVSIATIAASGPFSTFAGVDRTIVLLEGDGVRLRSADGAIDHRLDTPLAPFAFGGDEPIDCTLLGGASDRLQRDEPPRARTCRAAGFRRTDQAGARRARPAAQRGRLLARGRRQR